jgi:hypothetical protein
MGKMIINNIDGGTTEIDLFEMGKGIATYDLGYEYKPVYGGKPYIPNAWHVKRAIKQPDNPDVEWCLTVEGVSRRVTFVLFQIGKDYDFTTNDYKEQIVSYGDGGGKKFRKGSNGLKKFLFSKLSKRYCGNCIKELIVKSIPIIDEIASKQIQMAKDLARWRKNEIREIYESSGPIQGVVEEMIAKANSSGKTIGTVFNGVQFVVKPNSNIKRVLSSFRSRLRKKEERETAINK